MCVGLLYFPYLTFNLNNPPLLANNAGLLGNKGGLLLLEVSTLAVMPGADTDNDIVVSDEITYIAFCRALRHL